MELAQFDWTLYWFMFPVAVCVATAATFSGIAGSAIFAPIFMIVFPVLGPEYAFSGIAAAISVALFTTTFGMLSGAVGYFRRRLIDFRCAVPFILVAVPVGIVGAILLAGLKEYENLLRGAYAMLMALLAYDLARGRAASPPRAAEGSPERPPIARERRRIVGRDGVAYVYAVPRQGKGAIATGIGGFLTGLLGVGIGEVVMPQLARRNEMPIPVAAATSLFVVVLVVAAVSFTQISALAAAGGLGAVPWNVVVYTVPAVIIGGQIGPRLQGRISQRAMEIAIGGLFAAIGVAMGYIALRDGFFA